MDFGNSKQPFFLVIRDAVETRYPTRQYSRDQIIVELVASFLKFNQYPAMFADLTRSRRESEVQALLEFEGLWEQVEEIVQVADDAVASTFGSDPSEFDRQAAWEYRAPSELNSRTGKDRSLPLEELSTCAIQYLRSQWAVSAELELWLTRMMMFAEIFAFHRETNGAFPISGVAVWWRFAKAIVLWIVAIGSSFTIAEQHGAGTGLLAFGIWMSIFGAFDWRRWQLTLPVAKTRTSMVSAYKIVSRNRPLPIEVKRALTVAEENGAVWPHGLWSLVERAIGRDGQFWRG